MNWFIPGFFHRDVFLFQFPGRFASVALKYIIIIYNKLIKLLIR